MESMSAETILAAHVPIRPLKRVEYERLAALGYFDDERVELLLGLVVPMSPTDPAHDESKYLVGDVLKAQLGKRARVRTDSAFAASDVSEPQPDVAVVPEAGYWAENPRRAFLIVEVARSSLRKDKGPKAVIYGLAEVDEYWIVNHEDEVVEAYRDHHDGEWRQRFTFRRGDEITVAAFPDVRIAVSDILPPA